jgi:DNA-binding FadR family transcriptional regulator
MQSPSARADATDTAERADDRSFQPERVLRPREQVEAQLKRAILTGVFQHGARLPSETRLAATFSVSRSTVREALGALQESGLITKLPGAKGGSFVEYVDYHMVSSALSNRLMSTLALGSITYEEVSEFRNLLDVPSARLASSRRTEEDLADLWAIVEAEKTVRSDDPTVPELNIKFHVALATASGNRLLTATVTALYRVARPLAFIAASPEVGQQAVRHHIDIVNRVRQMEPDAAVDAMKAHLEYLRKHTAH